MKKIFIMLCLASMTGVSANAQLKVNISGKVGIKTSYDPLSALSINCTGNSSTQLYVKGAQHSIYSQRKGNTGGDWGYALNSKSCTEETNFSVGVFGESIASDWKTHNSGRSFGVMGSAGYATSGWNYGVFGRLQGTNNGAGIYGTSDANENGTYVAGRYAGYFNGNVQINGALKVSGAINGVILGQAATTSNQIVQYSSRQTNNEMEMSIADKLSSLSAVSYYKEQPVAMMVAANTGDSTEVTRPQLSFVELQDMEKAHYALSAEQVENVFPELVYENEDGSKSINYMEMVPLLIQSINELKTEIEVLKGNKIQGKKSAVTGLSAIEEAEVISLGQNTPNPFHTTTSIPVNIPTHVKSASLVIYNMNGKQIKQIELSPNGAENITINSSELEAGMYIYTLMTDGKIIATKRMVLTK